MFNVKGTDARLTERTLGSGVRRERFVRAAWSAALLIIGSGCPAAPNSGDGGGAGPNGDGGSGGGSIAAKLVFGVIGDYGDDDDDTRDVADLMIAWNPDFIATVGDNDYSDGAFRGTFRGLELGVGQFFSEFIGNYQGSEGPGSEQNRFFPIPGDHDWGDTCDDPAGLDDYLAYFTLPSESSGNERYYDFRRAGVHFFALDTVDGCEPDGVTADSTQAMWVRDTALASDAPFKVVLSSNPPYSSGARHIGDGDHMRWPWKDWGIDLVISGDDHVYERIERDGVVYVVNGLGGVDRHEFVANPQPGSRVRFADAHGAMRISVFDDRIEASFITVNGDVIDTFTITGEAGSTAPPPPTDGLDPNVAPITDGDWVRLDVASTWQWQLQPAAGGGINTAYDVDVYDIDLFDADQSVIDALHAAGRTVVCYFSAGSFEDFRSDSTEFEPGDLGKPLEDFGDEKWLDIRSSNVHRIMLDRLDLAVQKRCDGVEPDNVDGFDNDSGFDLTATDQLAFNRFIANAAHERGLSVALKNDLGQIDDLVDYFDFSVNEQCNEFDECALLDPFIIAGKPVFNAEYAASFVNDLVQRQALCDDARTGDRRTLVLPLDLDDSFRFSCDE